jgi:hypothetical protein
MSAVAEEKRPGRDWDELPFPGHVMDRGIVQTGSAWSFGPIRVISTLTMAELPDGSKEIGPQWHISITDKGRRPSPKQVRRALRAFDMVDAEEDNHHPGYARHFWLPVDLARRVDCECKAEEVTIVEADGYRFTNPHDPAECRGCDFQRLTGKPCPLHASKESTSG